MKRCVCLARNIWTCCSLTSRCQRYRTCEACDAVSPRSQIIFMTGDYSRAAEAKELGKLLFKPFREMETIAALNAAK
jgi:hypothetical protein